MKNRFFVALRMTKRLNSCFRRNDKGLRLPRVFRPHNDGEPNQTGHRPDWYVAGGGLLCISAL